MNEIDLDRALVFGRDAFEDGSSFNPSENEDFLSYFADEQNTIMDLAKAYVLGWTIAESESKGESS